jgi:hypothetical protein
MPWQGTLRFKRNWPAAPIVSIYSAINSGKLGPSVGLQNPTATQMHATHALSVNGGSLQLAVNAA